jgi:hypothetical protein
VEVPIVPVVVLPPGTPFTYHVTIVVVLLVSVVFDRVTCAENCACSLIGTVADAGEIVTTVTVTVPPLPPPHDEMPSKHASATDSSNIPRIPFRIDQPSLPASVAYAPALRAISFTVRAASARAAMPVIRLLLCCLVICLGPLFRLVVSGKSLADTHVDSSIPVQIEKVPMLRGKRARFGCTSIAYSASPAPRKAAFILHQSLPPSHPQSRS